MANPEVVLETRNLTKKYGEFTALEDLSIAVNRGQILGFIGPNGAGKTTTIKILVGLARPTSGLATIAGVDCVRDARRIKRLVGYMPDQFGSYDNMRVHEYLDFFSAAFGISRRLRRARIDEVLETTSSGYMRDRYVESLSHGMKQRLGIARTLLHDPAVLILDEPANGLDPQARIEMRHLLLHLAALGKTLLVTSHILPELARICHVVAMITHGKLRAFGTLDEILRQIKQRRTIEVLLADRSQLSPTARVLREVLGAEAAIEEAPAEQVVRFQTQEGDRELGDILGQLIHDGCRVSQFREVQSDLEDAFLTVTKETAAAKSPVPATS